MFLFVIAALASPAGALSLQVQKEASVRISGENASKIVWITAFARSSSSTVLSMVETALLQEKAYDPQHDLFALFEPCHVRNRLDPKLEQSGCNALLGQVIRCNFSGVYELHGWDHDHSVTGGGKFSKEIAESRCRQAKLIAVKTVNVSNTRPDALQRRGSVPVAYTDDLATMGLRLLEEVPELRIIHVVRDPRAIFASMMSTPAFVKVIDRQPKTLTTICDSMQADVKVRHPRLFHMRFETFVTDPARTVRGVMAFLGVPFGRNQLEWINQTFKADCRVKKSVLYDDCHANPEAGLEKWRSVLTREEKMAFENHPTCCETARKRKYPFDNCPVEPPTESEG
eukprot:TRINITY_DN4568_c0_g1_i1.p1 TRINITY_DN4568_c0_g1~~TRINITY_DN4568_c0_g1_i1.p1  ORF type:complete len:342 (+),score=55.67 TRINITY_DN4568_c0_g1_i1:110-1135(+)